MMRRIVTFAVGLGCFWPGSSWGAETSDSLGLENLFSLSVVQDFGLHQGANPCTMSNQIDGGFACFRASGTQYHGHPLPNASTAITSFPQWATTRLLGGYDRVLYDQYTVGVRLGWVLQGGGPRPDGALGPDFLPFHGELRIAYTLGQNPFRREGLRVSLFANGGLAQVDTEYRVGVEEDTSRPPPAGQLDNPETQELSVYRKTGTGFFGGGVTLGYVFSRRFNVSLGAKMMRMFPTPGTIFSLEMGVGAAF